MRLTNRLGKKLLELSPELLLLGKLKNEKIIALLAKYPDLSRYHKITLKMLLAVSGIGKIKAPHLLAGLHELAYMPEMTAIYKTIIFRFSSQSKLAIYYDITCVTSSSGKMTKTRAVYKANKIAKQTLITIAEYSIRFNPECRDYYL